MPRRYIAITFASHVLTREARLDESVLRHERVHVEQWKRDGKLRFLLRYLWFHFRFGYEGNPYEIEARRAEWAPNGSSPERDGTQLSTLPGDLA